MTEPLPPHALLPPPSDALCVDFANTLAWRGSAPPEESLRAPADLLAWIAAAGLAGGDAAGARWAGDAGEAELRTALDWREAIYRALAGPEAEAADLATLNAALAATPGRRHLVPREGGFGWQVASWTPTLPCLLAPVLWSAADLLAGPRRGRVRTCANPACRWLFLDDSKAGTRRWCSMASCGNRAKAHRHYTRAKAVAPAA